MSSASSSSFFATSKIVLPGAAGKTVTYFDVPATTEPGSYAPPLLFLHGFLDSCLSWTRLISSLVARLPDTRSRRIIALSLPGWGDSSAAPSAFTVASYAADVEAFLDAIEVSHVIACGHSMGTLVASVLAARSADRVVGLALFGAAAKLRPEHIVDPSDGTTLGDLGKQFASFPDGVVSAAAGDERIAFLRAFQVDSLPPSQVPPEFSAQVMQETLKAEGAAVRGAWADMEQEDHQAELASIACPVLIVAGEEDPVFDRMEQARLLGALRTTSVTFRTCCMGAQHSMTWTHPDQCADYLASWLAIYDE